MALNPKSKVFQVRVDPALFDAFQAVCASQDMTVSEGVRQLMRHRSAASLQARGAVSAPVVVAGRSDAPKTPPPPLKTPPNDKKLRRLAKKQMHK